MRNKIRQPVKLWWGLLMLLITNLIAVGFVIWYVNQSDRRICKLVQTQIEAYETPPGPQSEVGKITYRELKNYAREVGCHSSGRT